MCGQLWFGGLWPPVSFSLNVEGGDYDKRSREWDDTPCLHNSVLHREQRHCMILSGESYMSHRTVLRYESVTSGVWHTHQRGYGMSLDYFIRSIWDHRERRKWWIIPRGDSSFHREVSLNTKTSGKATGPWGSSNCQFCFKDLKWRVLVFLCFSAETNFPPCQEKKKTLGKNWWMLHFFLLLYFHWL